MRIKALAFAALLFMISDSSGGSPHFTPARAQQILPSNSAVAEDEQAIALLKASLSAVIGSATVVPSTLVASGTITEFGGNQTAVSYPVRIRMRNPDKFRWDADLPEGTTSTVINGPKAQSQLASTVSSLMAWEVGGQKMENFPIFLLQRWLTSDGIKVQFAGQETIDGQTLYHISVADLSQSVSSSNRWRLDQNKGHFEIYIDPATSHLVRLRYYQETNDTNLYSLGTMDIVYSNFRTAGQSVFPFKLTRYIGGTKISVIQLQSIQPDGAVNDQDFEVK